MAIVLARDLCAGRAVGIDFKEALHRRAAAVVSEEGLTDRVYLQPVELGRCPSRMLVSTCSPPRR